MGRDILASHAVLWDAIRPGGYYVIEDLFTAYHPSFGGGPPGTPGTAVELIKTLVDDTVLRSGNMIVVRGDKSAQRPIAAIHVYGNIVFLERAR
jgi:demethylmacrocin O-methyltransferase